VFPKFVVRRQNKLVPCLTPPHIFVRCTCGHRIYSYSEGQAHKRIQNVFDSNIQKYGEGRGKGHPITGHEGPEGE
jgi:hypothetical protein